jgi:peptide/nickel transport system permease protein
MLLYLIRRIAYAVPIALGVSFIVFSLVHLAPGNPLTAVVPADAPAALVKELQHEYGFDRPLPVQFVLWLDRALHGDFGRSVANGRAVAPQVLAAVGNTLIIAIGAALLAFAGGLTLGGLAGYHHGRWPDKLATSVAMTGVSLPHYWLGMMLVVIFAVEFNALPAMGMGAAGSAGWGWDWAHLRFALLPAVTLAAIPLGIVTRTVRATVADMLGQDFVEALRAKGMTGIGIARHVARNVAPTVLAVVGLQLGYLLGGSILVETVFDWPGTGFLLNNAILTRDLPMLQGTILVLALFFVVLNVVVDMLQAWIDPRIRRT